MTTVLIRLDKIGDLIATLPVDQNISGDVQWVLAKGLGEIARSSQPQRQFIELDQLHPWSAFAQLWRFLRTTKTDRTVIFYGPWWVSLATFLARIPLRGGRLSQWHSFLFLNRGLRQSRSLAEKHEADYNRELVEYTLGLSPGTTPVLQLVAAPATELLMHHGLQAGEFYVVHPGMFGSALNWPGYRYNELIELLVQKGTVVVTGTASDERFLKDIKLRWATDPRVRILQGQLKMNELLSVLASAQAVVAPSTGVLHLAAALGRNCVGLYSPVQVHHPRRWGPRGVAAKFLIPDVDCPGKLACLGESCKFYPCMPRISAQQVMHAL